MHGKALYIHLAAWLTFIHSWLAWARICPSENSEYMPLEPSNTCLQEPPNTCLLEPVNMHDH